MVVKIKGSYLDKDGNVKWLNEEHQELVDAIEAYQAGEESLKDVVDAVEGLQEADEKLKDIIAAVEDLQTGEETLQEIINSIEALQESTETIQGVINEIEGLRQDDDVENTVILNEKVTFIDESSAGDVQTVSIPAPTDSDKRDQQYMIYVYNGSDATTISVDLEIDWTDSGANERTIEYALFENLAALTSDSIPQDVEFLYNGGVLSIVNDTTIGVEDAYDVYVKVVRL